MPPEQRAPLAPNARSLLLPYAIALTIAMTVVQLVIALTGGRVTVLAGGLTALVALGVVAWLWRNYRRLTHVRFGATLVMSAAWGLGLITHLIASVVGRGWDD